MNCCKPILVTLLLFVLPASLCAQRATEWQLHSLAMVGGERFIGGGVGLALRSNGRMRAGATLSAGDREGIAAFRPEIHGSFHLNPFKRQGVSPYGGGGVAAVFAEDLRREYIIAFVGVESRPGRAVGWFAEVGLGGGVRVVAGIQYRRRRARANSTWSRATPG